jgi:hypothetical protein
VAKRKSGVYAALSGWLKIKNPNYTQSGQRPELFESFKAKHLRLVPIPKETAGTNKERQGRWDFLLGVTCTSWLATRVLRGRRDPGASQPDLEAVENHRESKSWQGHRGTTIEICF